MGAESVTEEWRVWPGDPLGFIEVSSLGNVRTWLQRVGGQKPGKRGMSPKLLKKQFADGYFRFGIYRNGKTKNYQLNRVICETFHGPPPSSVHQAAHNNGDAADNRASNLRWATAKENAADRVAQGKQVRKEKCHFSRATETQVEAIRKEYDKGISAYRLAAISGLSRRTIHRILNNESW